MVDIWGHTGQEEKSLLPGEAVMSVSRKASWRRCPLSWVWKAEKVFPGGVRNGIEERAEGVMRKTSMMLKETENK